MGIHIGSFAARSSRPKGDSRIYSMRFLINPNRRYIGCRLCATWHLCRSVGDCRRAMVRMMSVSHSRVMCCSGPRARTLVLSLIMCQPSLAMVLPAVARASPSRAFTGLRHAKFFRVTFATRSRSMGSSVPDSGSALTTSTFSTSGDGCAPPKLTTRTFEEARLAVLLAPLGAGEGGKGHPLISALDEYLYLKDAAKHNISTTCRLSHRSITSRSSSSSTWCRCTHASRFHLAESRDLLKGVFLAFWTTWARPFRQQFLGALRWGLCSSLRHCR